MAIKVFGHPISTASKRVLLALSEKELEYEFIVIDFTKGHQKQEPLISVNPFGQVPAFEDGDLKLFESRAITKYIAHAYADKGTPLLSEDPKKAGIILVWLEVEAQKFDAAAQKINYEIFLKPIMGQTTDEALVGQQVEQLAKVLDVYEARLTESKYLAGECFTLVDMHHVPVINHLFKTRVKDLFDERPHVRKWCADILARPAWEKVLAMLNA